MQLIDRISASTWGAPPVLWLASAAVWSVNPVLGFILLLAGVVSLWRRRVPTHVAVIAVATAYVVVWCALGQLLALADVTFLSSRIGWAIGWVVVTAAVVAAGGRPLSWLAVRRGGRTEAKAPVTRVRGPLRWTFLPAGLFVAVAGFQSASFDLVSRWITIGTDPMQLILLIQQMAREGALITTRNLGGDGNLAGQAYPKGLQWVITAALGPAADSSSLSSAQALELFIRTFAGFVWLTVAVMFCVAAGLFLSAARRWCQAPTIPLVAIGCLLLGALGVQQFGAVIVFQGALSSGAAIACVWVLFWVSLADVRLRVLVAVLGCAVFVTANTWQPIVVVIAAIGAFMLWPYRRGAVTWLVATRVHGVRDVGGVLLLGGLVVVITAVPITGLLMAGGVQHASANGGLSGPSLPALTLEVLMLLFVAVHFRPLRLVGSSSLARAALGAICGSGLVWLAMLAATKVDASAYYPQKVVWFATLFGWPTLALALGIVLVLIGRRVSPTFAPAGLIVRRNRVLSVVVAGLGLCLLAAIAPWIWSFSPLMFSAAVGNLDRPELAQIVSLPDPPAGHRYVPYLLNQPWEIPWKQSYEAAKFLAFRFDAPYLQWATSEPACMIIREQSPAVLVTIQSPELVAAALKRDHCPLTSWQTLQIR